MKAKYLEIGKNLLSYTTFGSGEETLLCFHGYDLNKYVFESVSTKIFGLYKVYSFDLPFHGDTEFQFSDNPILKTEIFEAFEKFFERENIKKFSLLGFSMGGRFVLCLAEKFASQTTDLYLLAPDGIKTSFWYNLGTYSSLVRKLFKSIIIYPKPFIATAKFLGKFRIVDAGVVKFAIFELNTEEKRRRLYYSWVVLRKLKVNQFFACTELNKYAVNVHIITGKFDKIVTTKAMQSFENKLENKKHFILDAGHTNLIEAFEHSYQHKI